MIKKNTQKRDDSRAQQLLDADIALRAAADAFSSSEDELEQLRRTAIEFAAAWNACEAD